VFDLGTVDKEDTITPTTTTTTTTTLSRRLLVAKGGEGGEGSGTQGYKKGRGVKRPRSPPTGGEKKRLKLTLKIIADVALVGVPNAGKSTFLASVTRAKPKIANYPFTTVIPNLGVWVPQNAFDKADGSASAGLALCVS
jgi:GTP-binding protein